MAQDIRITGPTLKVLKLLLEKPRQGRSGAEMSRAVGISSGTLYPLLARLEDCGWIRGKWEKIEPTEAGRPRRRFYTLTATGQTNASRVLGDFQTAPGDNWDYDATRGARKSSGMPAFNDILTVKQARAIQAYILSRAAESSKAPSN